MYSSFLQNEAPQSEGQTEKSFTSQKLIDALKKIYNFYHGRIPKVEQILLCYPEYLIKFFELEKTLLIEEGPLPVNWRYFLALLVSQILSYLLLSFRVFLLTDVDTYIIYYLKGI